MKFLKRIFCKHRFEIIRRRYGFFVCNYVVICISCGKERKVNKKDLIKHLLVPKNIKEDISKACIYYKTYFKNDFPN